MLKILLIHPPSDLESGVRSFGHVYDRSQPLGLAYIAAALENAGYDVKIIDAKAERFSIDSILEHVSGFNPGIVGLGSSTPDFCITRLLAEKIKSLGDYTVVIGGPHVSALPEETMETGCFDYGVLGEGERTIVELADAISARRKDKIPDIKGIIFNNGKKPVRTTKRPYIEDLDTIPLPARHLLPPVDKYRYCYYKSLPNAIIITSRGCPYKCVFCDQAVFGNQFRTRSAGHILDEIQVLVDKYGVSEVSIVDDLFTFSPERVMELCRKLISRNLKIDWSCMGRVDRVTPETLKAMKASGCWQIGYGVESGNQRVLDNINKGIKLECIEKTIHETRKAGIKTVAFFMIGLPGDNDKSIRDTLKFAKKLPLDRAVFFITQPFPGSKLYKTALARGEIKKDVEYRHYHKYSSPKKLAHTTYGLDMDTLIKYRKRCYRDFYLRPAYLLREIFGYSEINELTGRVVNFFKTIF